MAFPSKPKAATLSDPGRLDSSVEHVERNHVQRAQIACGRGKVRNRMLREMNPVVRAERFGDRLLCKIPPSVVKDLSAQSVANNAFVAASF